jgi:hypothetical protein
MGLVLTGPRVVALPGGGMQAVTYTEKMTNDRLPEDGKLLVMQRILDAVCT